MSSFQPAKLLILASTLNKAGLISKNGKAFFKELILGRDPRCAEVVRLADACKNNLAFRWFCKISISSDGVLGDGLGLRCYQLLWTSPACRELSEPL